MSQSIYNGEYNTIFGIQQSNHMSLPFKTSKKEQNLFHTFIQSAAQLPKQANIFPFFQFMDQSIRIKFNQLKKSKDKKQKSLTVFEQFWQQLDNDDKVSLFVNWTKVLNTAVLFDKNPKLKLDESINLQDQIFVKKTTIFAKWQKRNATLTAEQLVIARSNKNKNRIYDLKDYEIKKQRSRENFAWVLQPINKNGVYVQCGVPTQTMFDQWFNALKININNQRVRSFVAGIKQDRQNPGSVRRNYSEFRGLQQKKEKSMKAGDKTLTERMIDQQLKITEFDGESEGADKDEFQDFEQKSQQKKDQGNKHADSESENDENPNIFKKLVPDYTSIMNFTDTPLNSTLLHCDSEYRIYELPSRQGEDISLKVYIVLPYPKSLIFQAIGSENMAWNDEIDLLTVKTKISSQNTVLFYQKNKAQGILYRQRDYLYLRHCFSISNMKQKNTFLVDKSIDSIHHPPFMTVVRAEKQLIWGLVEKESGKECILAVEGWIRGGGYMGAQQSKDMTYKYMKKLVYLIGFLKQLSFQQSHKSNILFKEDWLVDITNDDAVARKRSSISEFSKQEEDVLTKSIEKRQQELAEFIIRTSQDQGLQMANKSQVLFSDDRLQLQNYKPPLFNARKRVIVPQDYLNVVHVLNPKQKPKKPKLFPHYRGHHLWKGEWQIIPTGGLAYIDADKMQEQRKVLTYIIKRIGRNILSGKGILNISLPVDIFCCESNIERIAMSMGFFPHYLQKAAQIKQPEEQLKCVISAGMASGLIYLSMEKPFNPILGQTYQCWIDDCPIYFEQISHHPPIAAFMMKGRGYTVSGCVEAKMEISINGGTGINQGVITVAFDNGNTIYYTSAPGCLSGLTYGDRKLNLIGKCYYWNNEGLFLEVNYNPALKTKGFFGGVKGEGEQKLSDYFEGYLKQYPASAVKQLCWKKTGDGREIPTVPKGLPNAEPIKQLYKVYGRWNKYVTCGEQKVFDIDENRYFSISEEKYPLPSHSNFREDIVYRRMRDFVVSQEFKEVLEVQQRDDRKQRARFSKSSNN